MRETEQKRDPEFWRPYPPIKVLLKSMPFCENKGFHTNMAWAVYKVVRENPLFSDAVMSDILVKEMEQYRRNKDGK